MTSDREHHVERDPLIERAAPLLAKAMLIADDRDDLWAYFRDRVESERLRIEDDIIRDALEPLHDRFSMEAVARVAAAMAQEDVANDPG
jgi:hypothetical protein